MDRNRKKIGNFVFCKRVKLEYNLLKITLDSAKGKKLFYEKFGFKVRPNEDAGPGMDQWIIKE